MSIYLIFLNLVLYFGEQVKILTLSNFEDKMYELQKHITITEEDINTNKGFYQKKIADELDAFNDKNKPQLMTDDWEPDESCYDVLKLSGIKKKFAKQQLAEFRIFWIDSKEIMTSWNSKFIQHVKFKWYKKNPNASGIISRLNDKEWAVDIEN